MHSSEGTLGTDMRSNLQLRVHAEEVYRRSQAVMKVNRAMNSQVRPHQIFLPGDLVYYKRFKTPVGQTTAHPQLDIPKIGLSRWFGPGRVLATETRTEVDPGSKKPASVVWIVANGRLKRCSPHQLRHCSEKEKRMAEASEAVTMPWSFNSLLHLVQKGEYQRYDDILRDELEPQFRERESRAVSGAPRSRSRGPIVQRPKEAKMSQQKPSGQDSKPPRLEQEGERHPKRKASEPDRPDRLAMPQISREGRVRSHGTADAHRTLSELIGAAETVDPAMALDEAFSWACQVEVALPEDRKNLKQFIQNSEKWVSKKLKKGAELKWAQIPKDRYPDFEKAKEKEIGNWLKQQAIKLVERDVPKNRVLRMRWIFTIKHDNSAKARLVIIGYEDPDLEKLQKSSPTMSRRSRSLFLTACALFGWTVLKGDVKGAFLQGRASEEEREVFTKPVIELSRALGGNEHSIGQISKACYGLANAPAEWYYSVAAMMEGLGFQVLQTEPCGWRLLETDEEGKSRLVGLAVAHVDDFLFAGDTTSDVWNQALEGIYRAFEWSPWEIDNFSHCGVQVCQSADGTITLDHSAYCSEIDQIQVTGDDKDPVTEKELSQLRGLLGAIQWRAYQSAPQHSSRLSQLQGHLTCATKATLREANKLAREVFLHKHVGLRYQKLQVENAQEVTFVAWCDAAVGNRRDFASSGGYFIGATEPRIMHGQPAVINPISWKAGRLPRVARSSLSAEVQAMSIAEEELMYVRLQWLEMIGHELPRSDLAQVIKSSPGILVTDAKSLYDVIQKGPTASSTLKEKYSILDMISLFQRLKQGETSVRWVHSDAQLADALTKNVANSSLLRVLVSGRWTLVDDPSFTSAKRLKSERSKMLQQRTLGRVDPASIESMFASASFFTHDLMA